MRTFILSLLTLCLVTPAVHAAPIVAGATVLHSKAIQDITLLPGTPFNPTSSPIVIDDLFGIGPLTIFRDAQVGSTITFSQLDGRFFGSHPALGSYVFGRVAPLTPATYSGQIVNVVQDPLDPGFATGQPSSFRSGDISWGGANFGFEFLTGPAAGIRLYTDPAVPFSFSSTYDGLPPSVGTVNANSGSDVLNVLFNGQVVAQTSDRRVVSFIPEPSSIMLVIIGFVGALGYGWRRRTWNGPPTRAVTLGFLALIFVAPSARAAPIVAGSATQSYINIQQIRLFPGTPFNPGPEAVEFELIARGPLTATWDAQVGGTMQHAVPFVDFEGVFPGGIPFHILAGTPDLPPTVGEFSNIVQNPADPGFAAGDPSSLVSADYMNTAYFKQVLPDGTTIYSDQINPAVFTATLAGLPYPIGQEFVSTGPLNMYVQLGGAIDQANDFLIGQSLHRVVTVVPEPTALMLLSIGAVCLFATRLWC